MASMKDLIDAVSATTNLTNTEVREVILEVFKHIPELIQEDDHLIIPNFGTFKKTERAERVGRNPQTGGALVIPAQVKLTFKASKPKGE